MPGVSVAVRLGSLRVNWFLGECMIPYLISFQILNFTLHNAYKHAMGFFSPHSNETVSDDSKNLTDESVANLHLIKYLLSIPPT